LAKVAEFCWVPILFGYGCKCISTKKAKRIIKPWRQTQQVAQGNVQETSRSYDNRVIK
jgi:hypothetical protein